MCGIAGYMVKGGSAAPAAALEDYATALSHRGPDGTGHYQSDGVGLVQTRLAIIDLKTGDQPLYGAKNTVLVANGEIYNYLELRRDFPLASFTTQSDCELPLFCHARDGTDFAKALRGMYGIALFDPAENALFLSRDPFGIKPLYYATIEGGLAFASEPQALLAAGLVRREICIEKANELLQLQFTTGRSTIFKGIERVLPGETLRVQAGEITERRRHGALPDGPPQDISESEALERLDTALMDSVAVHQRADVPYGMFLSGGVDSSALLACMARLNDKPVRAFTAGFPGTAAHDEREHAKRVAKAAGAEHVEISVTEKDFWSHLPAIAAAMDDPVADYAIVPIYLLAREAAKDLKVVLCGEGGDELFAGYGRYRSALRPWFLGGRAMRRRGFLDGLGVLRDSSRRWRDAIAASERTAEALRVWLKDRRRFVTNGTTKMFVSVGGTTPGSALTVNGLRAIYRKMGKQAGFELSPHDIRRSFAIAAIKNGAPIPVVMRQGGWTNLQVFMEYLRRLMPEDFGPYLPTNGIGGSNE
ncbi:MAG: asparagine synthase (glutamine-hydrolyzing) [Proteobacteria bacterium]|nr:asparagine synthase (glutamine-hydrolyzing) [Pseudomonadota bacterium]